MSLKLDNQLNCIRSIYHKMVATTVLSIILGIELANCLLHGTGVFLLFKLYKRNPNNSQRIFLLNLACSELLLNILMAIREAIKLMFLSGNYDQLLLLKLNNSLEMSIGAGVFIIYILAMFYLTADRLVRILLLLRYPQCWNSRRSKVLLASTWIILITICIVLSILTYYKSDWFHKNIIHHVLFVYIPTCLFSLYFVFAIFTYTTIIMVHVNSKRKISKAADAQATNDSFCKIFIQVRFVLLFTLITSFMILTIIPSLARSFWFITAPKTIPIVVDIFYHFLTVISLTVDAVLYTFLQKAVRQLLHKMLPWRRYFSRRSSRRINIEMKLTGECESCLSTPCSTRRFKVETSPLASSIL